MMLQDDIHKWRQIEATIHDVMSLFDYEEVRPAILQDTDTLLRGLTEITLEKTVLPPEKYVITVSNEKRELSLRPEGTITLLNSSLSTKAQQEAQRVYYIGPMFRRLADQGCKEFIQLGAEALGVNCSLGDNEIMNLALRICRRLGLPNIQLEVGSFGCEKCRPSYVKVYKDHLDNHQSDLCDICRTDLTILPECANESCKSVYETSPMIKDYLCPDCMADLQQIQRTLSNLMIPYTTNHRLYKNFDYYNRTVFTISSTYNDQLYLLGGGGRYDCLSKRIIGKELPSIGFALDLDTVFSLMKEAKLFRIEQPPFKVYLYSQTPTLELMLAQIRQELHSQNFSTVIGNTGADLNKESKQARKKACSVICVLREDSVLNGKVLITNLNKDHQESVNLRDILNHLSVIRRTTS